MSIRLILVGPPRQRRHSACLTLGHFGSGEWGLLAERTVQSELGDLVLFAAHATGHAANTPATTAIASPSPSPSPINRRHSAFQCTRGRSSSRLQPKKRPLSGQLGTLPAPADFKRMRPPLATSCMDAGLCVNANDIEQASVQRLQQRDGESINPTRSIPLSVSASGCVNRPLLELPNLAPSHTPQIDRQSPGIKRPSFSVCLACGRCLFPTTGIFSPIRWSTVSTQNVKAFSKPSSVSLWWTPGRRPRKENTPSVLYSTTVQRPDSLGLQGLPRGVFLSLVTLISIPAELSAAALPTGWDIAPLLTVVGAFEIYAHGSYRTHPLPIGDHRECNSKFRSLGGLCTPEIRLACGPAIITHTKSPRSDRTQGHLSAWTATAPGQIMSRGPSSHHTSFPPPVRTGSR